MSQYCFNLPCWARAFAATRNRLYAASVWSTLYRNSWYKFNCSKNPRFGSIIARLSFIISSACCADNCFSRIMYAATMVGLRETPAWQCTSTRPLLANASLINSYVSGKYWIMFSSIRSKTRIFYTMCKPYIYVSGVTNACQIFFSFVPCMLCAGVMARNRPGRQCVKCHVPLATAARIRQSSFQGTDREWSLGSACWQCSYCTFWQRRLRSAKRLSAFLYLKLIFRIKHPHPLGTFEHFLQFIVKIIHELYITTRINWQLLGHWNPIFTKEENS